MRWIVVVGTARRSARSSLFRPRSTPSRRRAVETGVGRTGTRERHELRRTRDDQVVGESIEASAAPTEADRVRAAPACSRTLPDRSTVVAVPTVMRERTDRVGRRPGGTADVPVSLAAVTARPWRRCRHAPVVRDGDSHCRTVSACENRVGRCRAATAVPERADAWPWRAAGADGRQSSVGIVTLQAPPPV